MTTLVNTKLDFGGARRITNLAAGAAAGEPIIFEQFNAGIEGLAWKDSVRVASIANLTVASPGATIDGITMATSDRILLKNQTTQTENGVYIWNGAATPATRALDGDTFAELESAIVPVEEGTNAGTQWRQTQVNGVVGTNNVIFTSFGTSSPAASETVSGIMELATQAETDTGTDDLRAVTPLKFKTASFMLRKYSTSIGDGSATSIVVTHNLNSTDIQVQAWETGGSKREVLVEKQATGVNSCTIIFDSAPASSAIRIVVMA